MRLLFLALSALATFVASPALADLRASYRVGMGEGARTMTIEVSDAGVYRVAMPLGNPGSDPFSFMFGTEAGEVLFAMPSPEGVIVVRSADFMAITDELMAQAIPADRLPPPGLAEVRLREAGAATVNGRVGRRFVLEPPANAGAAPPQIEIVVSADPALAPLVRVMTGGLAGMEDSPLFERLAPPVFRHMAELARTNALLRVGEIVELTAVENGPLPPESFAPPGPPISRGELRALLERMFQASPPQAASGPPAFNTVPVSPGAPATPPDSSDAPVFDVDAPPPPPEPD